METENENRRKYGKSMQRERKGGKKLTKRKNKKTETKENVYENISEEEE